MSDGGCYCEAFVAAGEQRARCGHVVAPGGVIVDVHEGSPFTRVTFQCCGPCFDALGRSGLAEPPR